MIFLGKAEGRGARAEIGAHPQVVPKAAIGAIRHPRVEERAEKSAQNGHPSRGIAGTAAFRAILRHPAASQSEPTSSPWRRNSVKTMARGAGSRREWACLDWDA